jgi:hypothetical protein
MMRPCIRVRWPTFYHCCRSCLVCDRNLAVWILGAKHLHILQLDASDN